MKLTEIVKYFFLWGCFTSFAITGYTQNYIKGNVSDKLTGVPLTGVSIIGRTADIIQGYTTSDYNGNFILKNDNKANYTTLLFTYMGYKQYSIKITESMGELKILMEEGNINIKPLVVRPQAIIYKNDTTIYNASSFTRKGDNTIAEVINRLPNVAITSKGTININGQNINKFYIENLDLLGGRYGIAINNIKPDDISAIEVYKNHQPILALKGIEQSSQAAMNIILKDNARSKWLLSFGAILGYGDSLIYNGNVNAMRFSKTNQNIFIIKANNNGTNIIRETQSQSLEPGMYKVEDLNGLENTFSIGNRYLPIKDDYYYINNSQIGSVNTLHKLSKTAEVKVNLNFAANNLKSSNYNTQIYDINNNSNINITESSIGLLSTYQLTGEVAIQENSKQKYLKNKLSFESDWDKYTRNVLNNNSFYGNKYNLPKFGIKNKLSIINNNKNGTPLRFESLLDFYNANQKLTISSDSALPMFNKNKVEQYYSLLKFKTDNFFSFYKKIKKLSITYTPGLKLNYEQLNSYIAPSVKVENINNENDLGLLSIEPYIKLKLYYSISKFTIDLSGPLSLRYDRYIDNNKLTFIYSPYLYLKYDISSKFLVLSTISASNRLDGIKEYARGYIFNDYRTAYAKEGASLPIYQKYYLSVKYMDILLGIGANLFIDHQNFYNNITVSDFFYEDILFNTQIKGDNKDKNTSVGLDLLYRLGLNILSVNAQLKYNMGSSSQLFQNQVYDYNTRGYDIQGNLSIFPVDWFYIDYKFNYSYSALINGTTDREIRTYLHKLEATVIPFEKFNIRGSFDYYIQNSYQYEASRLPFLNTYISYSHKKIKYFVNITNILNTKEYINSYFSGMSSRHSITALRGCEFTAGISLNL